VENGYEEIEEWRDNSAPEPDWDIDSEDSGAFMYCT
jgi:hypothetical protein